MGFLSVSPRIRRLSVREAFIKFFPPLLLPHKKSFLFTRRGMRCLAPTPVSVCSPFPETNPLGRREREGVLTPSFSFTSPSTLSVHPLLSLHSSKMPNDGRGVDSTNELKKGRGWARTRTRTHVLHILLHDRVFECQIEFAVLPISRPNLE